MAFERTLQDEVDDFQAREFWAEALQEEAREALADSFADDEPDREEAEDLDDAPNPVVIPHAFQALWPSGWFSLSWFVNNSWPIYPDRQDYLRADAALRRMHALVLERLRGGASEPGSVYATAGYVRAFATCWQRHDTARAYLEAGPRELPVFQSHAWLQANLYPEAQAWDRARLALYKQKPSYKTQQRSYDARRNATPERRAAAAERKRRARAAKRLAVT